MDVQDAIELLRPYLSRECFWAYVVKLGTKTPKNVQLLKSWRKYSRGDFQFTADTGPDGKAVLLAILNARVPTRALRHLASKKSVERILEIGLNPKNKVNTRPQVEKVDTVVLSFYPS